jgi:hypothetical protein
MWPRLARLASFRIPKKLFVRWLSVRPSTNYNKADTVGHVSYLSLNTADSSYRILDVNVCLRQNRFDPHFLPGPPRPWVLVDGGYEPVPSLTLSDIQQSQIHVFVAFTDTYSDRGIGVQVPIQVPIWALSPGPFDQKRR